MLPAVTEAGAAAVIALLFGYRPPAWHSWLPATAAAALCAWGWLGAQAALEVVVSEPLDVPRNPILLRSGGDGLQAVLDTLSDPNPLTQVRRATWSVRVCCGSCILPPALFSHTPVTPKA